MTEEGDETPPPAPTPTPTPASGDRFDVNAVTDELINTRGGGFEAARQTVRKLLWDNSKLRSKLRMAKERTVADGDVILKASTPELDQHNKMKLLNMTPEQINAKLTEHAALQEKVKGVEQEQFFDKVAESIGIPNKKAFAKLAKQFGIAVELRDVEVQGEDGKKLIEKKPYARLATDTAADYKPLDVYLDAEFGEFRPALYAEDADALAGNGRPGGGTEHAPERKVTPMATQSGSGGGRPKSTERSAVESVLAGRYGSNAKK
ncbi:MAG: hypothetical protein ABI119_05960 [Gemmatimonadaceae bacterium]